MTTEDLIKKSIDSRNQELWNLISETYNLNVDFSPEPNYLTNFKEDQITIYVDQFNCSPASMTHELLHIELKRRGILISYELISLIAKSEDLNYIFSKDLEDHISNCLEHVKMHDIFVNMGYSTQQFISDFDKKKMTNSELNSIKTFYKNKGFFDRSAIDSFIGNFFAMKACLNPKFNYKKYYDSLKKIDTRLYTLLYEFWEDWLTYDISDPEDSYNEILNFFIQDLLTWSEKKSII